MSASVYAFDSLRAHGPRGRGKEAGHMTGPEYVIVLTTLPTDADAVEFANILVRERLAACVNIQGEMRSIYRWQDDIEEDQEQQIVIKTTGERVGQLFERMRELHPYEVPEFLVVPVIDGSDAYLNWMKESTIRSAEV
jgi:periplasmic divalent cation tolerance protein